MPDTKKRICFVIAPIGAQDSEIRTRSDQLLNHVIGPAVQRCGYEKPVRADDIERPGDITSQVIQHVTDADLVIADLTGHNPNVFYELAIRHAFRKPLVQIAQKGEHIPFDVHGQRTIFVDHTNLDSVAQTIETMVGQIKSFESGDTSIDTPTSTSLELQSLRRSENFEERSLAEILSELSNIRSAVSEIRSYRIEERAALTHGELLGATHEILRLGREDHATLSYVRMILSEIASRDDAGDLPFE